MDDTTFIKDACDTYRRVNRDSLIWLLQRKSEDQPWINTKYNSITLRNYKNCDGLRGPNYTYGWIQGRGLEALVMHALYFKTIDNDLSAELEEYARVLYTQLRNLYAEKGYGHFCYDAEWQPICTSESDECKLQSRDPDISTYTDLFIVKGLIAASARFAPENLIIHLNSLRTIIEAIDEGRFHISESGPITELTLSTQQEDFGPMMIAMGAAALLHQLSLGEYDTFSEKYLDQIFTKFLDQKSGLLANSPGGDVCNVGHGIELAGFAFEIARLTKSAQQLDRLVDLTLASFSAGYNGYGLHLSLEIASLSPRSEISPWWSLPETIRAAALGYELTNNLELLAIWQSAHNAFFDNFWRSNPPVAYQSMTHDGPIDFVPATPDLDPGYHTGLSLLAAVEMAERRVHGLNSI